MITRNKYGVLRNQYQGLYKKVVCVCSAGCLRSPTAAFVLSQKPFDFNTRAVGVDRNYAIIPITEELIVWADEIVCMDNTHLHLLKGAASEFSEGGANILEAKPVIVLDIPDNFEYREPMLMNLIKQRYIEKTNFGQDN